MCLRSKVKSDCNMKQLEDVVSPAVTRIFNLLTLLFSLTGISLHPLKVR